MLKDIWLFRLEFFGGILINKITFRRIELTFDEALYVFARRYIDADAAVAIAKRILKKNTLDISKIETESIFEDDKLQDAKTFDETFELTKNAYEEIREKESLSFPLEIIIYPSMHCNLHCKFCFVGKKSDTLIYSAKDWGHVLEEAKENGILSVSILGGEPSLYFDIDNLLLKCEELAINTVITTNALRLKETTKKIIIDSEHITPAVSLQSLDNLNSLLMGCETKRQLLFIDECLKNKKEIRINSVYTFQTTEQIKKVYDYCVDKGISRYSVANYSNVKDNSEMKYAHNLSDLAELDKIMKEYIQQKYAQVKKLPEFAVEGCMLYSAYVNHVQEKILFSPFEKQYFGCRGKYTKMEIYSDGSVYPCCRYETIKRSTSNIFQNGSTLKKIWWNDHNYIELRRQKTQNTKCLQCAFLEICEGGCYPSRYKLDKENVHNIYDPNCQNIEGKYYE